MKVRFKDAVKRARAAVRRYGRAVWDRDRTDLDGWAALRTRFARIATWSIRGVFKNRLSLQAAALGYYTIFMIVPILVVVLWTLKLLHVIPYLTPEATSAAPDVTDEPYFPKANVLLREAARGILMAVDRAGRVETGFVGLAALAYGVIRSVIHVEAALDTIAGARDRPPRYRRMLGYLALLALPPALFIVSGLLHMLSHLPVGTTLTHWISWLIETVPLLKSTLGVVIGLGLLCLALAIFYASAARARIAFTSSLFGGALGAVLLAGVLWVFARLQIGVSRAGALESGMAAVPVFLLWSFSSWLVVLIGAQVAVAHELDGVLIHGTRTLRLDRYGEQVAGLAIMVEATRRALASHDVGDASANELACQLRLLPRHVRDVAGRLRDAGLLRQSDTDCYRLACDPDRTRLRDIVGAIIGRPEEPAALGRTGPSLHELAERYALANAK